MGVSDILARFVASLGSARVKNGTEGVFFAVLHLLFYLLARISLKC